MSPRLTVYLQKKGYSMLPMDAINYTTNIVNQVLARRRQHLERRNDFIQIMVDCEEEEGKVEHKEQTDKQGQQWGTLKKSNV
jgi:siroheme synthase (precorrin-2 oxidase/ferrochelatase)